MVNKALVGGIVGFLLGGLVVSLAYNFVPGQGPGEKPAHQEMPAGNEMMPHDDGAEDNLRGEAYERAYLSAMIAHHEGALHMAKEAKERAVHQEVKDMADQIYSSQQREIDQMRQWQSEWGYAQ